MIEVVHKSLGSLLVALADCKEAGSDTHARVNGQRVIGFLDTKTQTWHYAAINHVITKRCWFGGCVGSDLNCICGAERSPQPQEQVLARLGLTLESLRETLKTPFTRGVLFGKAGKTQHEA